MWSGLNLGTTWQSQARTVPDVCTLPKRCCFSFNFRYNSMVGGEYGEKRHFIRILDSPDIVQ
jgi:hypothetical protein